MENFFILRSSNLDALHNIALKKRKDWHKLVNARYSSPDLLEDIDREVIAYIELREGVYVSMKGTLWLSGIYWAYNHFSLQPKPVLLGLCLTFFYIPCFAYLQQKHRELEDIQEILSFKYPEVIK